jgi:hypothetical protein
MIARIERILHGGRRNFECLEEKYIDEGDHDYCEYYGIKPFICGAALFPFFVAFFPEVPTDFLRDENVEDNS